MAFAAENAGVDVRDPDKSPTIIAVNLLKSVSPPNVLPNIMHPIAESPPAIINYKSETYIKDLKFFFMLLKNFGPAIKPTDVTKESIPYFL